MNNRLMKVMDRMDEAEREAVQAKRAFRKALLEELSNMDCPKTTTELVEDYELSERDKRNLAKRLSYVLGGLQTKQNNGDEQFGLVTHSKDEKFYVAEVDEYGHLLSEPHERHRSKRAYIVR